MRALLQKVERGRPGNHTAYISCHFFGKGNYQGKSCQGKLLRAMPPARWDCPDIQIFCRHLQRCVMLPWLFWVSLHSIGLKGGWDKHPPGSRGPKWLGRKWQLLQMKSRQAGSHRLWVNCRNGAWTAEILGNSRQSCASLWGVAGRSWQGHHVPCVLLVLHPRERLRLGLLAQAVCVGWGKLVPGGTEQLGVSCDSSPVPAQPRGIFPPQGWDRLPYR